MPDLNIIGVEKSIGKQRILTNLSLHIPQNSVFFLVGLNGAGKTTLLKIIVGLLFPNNGRIEIAPEITKDKIGALIDYPCFYDSLSAYENLYHHALLLGINSKRIDDVMNVVRLDPSNRKPVKKYSLGMKQRLGIARALLGDSGLIILDEPFNGLDPLGIYEMRELIKKLQTDFHKTIIISSHLIKETEGLATDYAIIHHGYCFGQFSSQQLNAMLRTVTGSLTESNRPQIEEYVRNQNLLCSFGEKLFSIYCLDYKKLSAINAESVIKEIRAKYDPQAYVSEGRLEELFVMLTTGENANETYY